MGDTKICKVPLNTFKSWHHDAGVVCTQNPEVHASHAIELPAGKGEDQCGGRPRQPTGPSGLVPLTDIFFTWHGSKEALIYMSEKN